MRNKCLNGHKYQVAWIKLTGQHKQLSNYFFTIFYIIIFKKMYFLNKLSSYLIKCYENYTERSRYR